MLRGPQLDLAALNCTDLEKKKKPTPLTVRIVSPLLSSPSLTKQKQVTCFGSSAVDPHAYHSAAL